MSSVPTSNYGFPKVTQGTEKDTWSPITHTALDMIDAQIKNRQNEAAAALSSANAKAGLSSPAFIGTPTAPTAPLATNTTQIATTAFVQAAIAAIPPGSFTGGTLTSPLITAASISGAAGLRIPHGVAPSSPVNGDIWTTSAGVFARVDGNTVRLDNIEGP